MTRSVILPRARRRHGDTEGVFAVGYDTNRGMDNWRQSFAIATDPFSFELYSVSHRPPKIES